jgi:hypothetical protein
MKDLFFIFSIILFSSTISYSQTAEEINDKVIDAISIESMEMTATLKIYDNKGNVRERELSTASKKFGQTNKMLMRFTAPADVQGTTMLVHDHDDKEADMWIYLPALRRVRRIAGSDKANNFMGSEFTNADLSRPNKEDFNYKVLESVDIEGKKYWKIEAKAINEDVEDEYGFSKQISYIEQAKYLALKIEYYDLRGDLHRVQTIKDYRKQSNGKYFAFYMEMENKQNGRKSVMTIDQFQLGSKLEESVFAPALLEN